MKYKFFAKLLIFSAAILISYSSDVVAQNPDLTINNVSLNEGDAGTTTFTFTVSLSSPAGPGGVTFDIATSDATAQDDNPPSEDNDYVAKSLTIETIPEGNSTYTFDVTVNGDITNEINESFSVGVTNVTGAVVVDGLGFGSINNDDVLVSVAVAPASVVENGGTNLVYTFTRDGLLATQLTVNFSVSGTASFTEPDYTQTGAATFTATSGTVTFGAGSVTKTVTVDPSVDATSELDETVILTITSGAGYSIGSPSAATGTITNDDAAPVPNLTINNISQNEGDAGTTTFTFTVSLSSPAGPGGVTFDIATTDGSAKDDDPVTEDNDYVARSLTGHTIPEGSSSYTFDVTINGDVLVEPDENFFVNVTNVIGANVTDGQGMGTITNDEAEMVVTVAVSPASVSEDGGANLVYTFTRNVSTIGGFTVNFSIGSGGSNATFSTDYGQTGATLYTPPIGQVVFAGGSLTKTITINPNTDSDIESDETVILTITSGAGYTIGSPSAATGTISNDDEPAFDPCANKPTLTCATPVIATTSGDGVWSVTACGSAKPGQERIYSFTPTITGTHNLQVTATSLTVYDYFYKPASDGCDATDWICVTSTSTPTTIPIGTLTAGIKYYILLDPLFTSAESQTFQINCPADPCANPPALICGTPVTATTTGEGAWNITACGGTTPGQERIYSFIPAITGLYDLQVTSANAAFEYFYKAASDGCDATGWICIGAAGGTVTFFGIGPLTAGVTYYILQDAKLTSASLQTFQINCPADPCANISTLTCATPVRTFFSGSGVWNVAACGFPTPGQERVYSFIPATTGVHNLEVTATSGEGSVDYFYKAASDGCDATDWICINDITFPGVHPIGTLTAGTPYYILLDAEQEVSRSQTFQINCPAFDPCANITTLTCGTPVTATLLGSGVWNVTACGFATPGQERIYRFTAATTGVYNLEITATGGARIDYFYKATSGGCNASNWICLSRAAAPSTVPIGTLTAGTTYYILLDAENSIDPSSHTFKINCAAPCITCPAAVAFCKVASNTYTIPSLIAANNCGINTITYQVSGATTRSGSGKNASGTFNPGVSTIKWTVKDISNNIISTCSTTVTIKSLPVVTITKSDVANDFCNGITLTAKSTPAAVSYLWSNGSTTQSITLKTSNTAGNYSVKVTGSNGCSGTATYAYNPQNTISSYTIIGLTDVELDEKNNVVSGSVGVTTPSTGLARINKNTSIAGPGAFLKAAKMTIINPVNIPTKIFSAATVSLPTMQYNTTSTTGLPNATVPNNTTTTLSGNYKNITVGTNCNVTLNGSIFGNIIIGSRSIVKFTQSLINVTGITLQAGTSATSTRLAFSAGSAVVKSSGNINVATWCIVNPENKKVVFYLGKKSSTTAVDFLVASGGNITVNASMYIPIGRLEILGHATNQTKMTGKFIAKYVDGDGANIIWNPYNCSATGPSATTSLKQINEAEIQAETNRNEPEIQSETNILEVKVFPNPSKSDFNLHVRSNNHKDRIIMQVVDVYGRIRAVNTVYADGRIKIGSGYLPGTYFVRFTQGNNHKQIRLVKLSD